MGFEDYGKQGFVQEYQRQLEGRERRRQNKNRFAKSAAILLSIGIPTITAFEIGTYLFAKEEKPKTEEVSQEPTKEGSLKVAKPEKLKRAEPRKGEEEIPTSKGSSLELASELEGAEFVKDLIQKQYDYYNTETAEFYLTFENDPDGKIRNLIAELGKKYGDPENITTYQAIAAVESRYKWEGSDDGGIGYFQITNIPESVKEEVRKIAERDNITDEKVINIIEGIKTYDHYKRHVRNLRNNDTPEEQKYRAAWEYNTGYVVDRGSIEENLNRSKGVHKYYGAKVAAYEKALTEGYRH